jgi:hypothetical protein
VVLVVIGMGVAPYIVTYINYRYRRAAYHSMRVVELIIKMCFVQLLTPYGTIGTPKTAVVLVVIGMGVAPYIVTYINYRCRREERICISSFRPEKTHFHAVIHGESESGVRYDQSFQYSSDIPVR